MSTRGILGKIVAPYAAGVGLVLITTLLGALVRGRLEPTNLAMLYLLAVVVAAARWGRGAAVATAIASVLSFDLFLVPPYLALTVADIQYVFTFVGLLAVGLVVGTLAARMRGQALQARTREAQTAAMYRLSADLADAAGFEEVLRAIRNNVGRIVGCGAAIYLPTSRGLELRSADAGFPGGDVERGIARWAYENATTAGGGTGGAPRKRTRYFPFRTPEGVIGVLGVCLRRGADALTPAEEGQLSALVSQAAVAVQRAKLAEETRHLELMRQTEKFQSALLNSISHDLRTPLVSITGALTSVLEDDSGVDAAARKELLENASQEADRLNRIVGDLLDMARMEAGPLRVSRRPAELRDVLGASLEQLRARIGDRSVRIAIPKDYPEISIDFPFMMKAFYIVLDNALKFSPAGSPIDIVARVHRNEAEIVIRDRGSGIPEGDLTRIFEKFYRVEHPHRAEGTGLGLSICKGIIEAHGGRIAARNNPDGGAAFIVTLPLQEGRTAT
jgi:two-component system sensor histidine kinase KdpD